MSTVAAHHAGTLLREWRHRRRLSQLELALETGISTRHLSFVETGRSRPSPELLLRLADPLEVPLRERNQLLLAAGHAPVYGERDLDDPAMAPVRTALDLVLRGHGHSPALVVDRQWGLVAANAAVGLLTAGAAPELLAPPVNVLRLSLHPDGMASRIRNLAEWRGHVLGRLGREAAAGGDPALATLLDELRALPGGQAEPGPERYGEIAVPMILALEDGTELSLISTVSTFGTAIDVTLAELSIEAFFAADAETDAHLRRLAE
ncbi:helix-turn-helix domain-containing protein [Patulibacter minatonensis]|uniref:helix-turn-helix domain-containing protein n=1 Tax=Patulibacter minatonensis TaxID=298163 RepID=UPI00047E7FA8|nr:helix-turn-helix transcriptional regulator [Patulibacter minatonensis]